MFSILPKLRSFMVILLAVVLVTGSAIAFQGFALAQVSGPDKPIEGATPGGVNSGSASDAELWRQIRRGDSGTVVGGDKSGGMMIQSGGQDWRMIRNGPLPKYAAWAILGMLLLLSLFFALRGRIKIDHGPSGVTMRRFSLIERVGHWLLASSFILLALTGLNLVFGKGLLIPLLGKEAFASITVFGKLVHNYVGFAFILGLIMITVMWVVHNIPSWTDVKWLFRAGGMLGGGHPPAKKFNAGQKIIFWVVVLCGISISMSGWALMNPFTTNMFSSTFAIANDWFGTSYATDLAPIQEQQYQSLWHTIMAVFMIVVVLAHIYIGTIGMEGALPAMTTGEVDTNWAREHHSLWVEDEEAKNWGKPKPEVVTKASASPVLKSQQRAPGSPSAPSERLAALSSNPPLDTPISAPLPRVDSAGDSQRVRRAAIAAELFETRPGEDRATTKKAGPKSTTKTVRPSRSKAVVTEPTAPAESALTPAKPKAVAKSKKARAGKTVSKAKSASQPRQKVRAATKVKTVEKEQKLTSSRTVSLSAIAEAAAKPRTGATSKRGKAALSAKTATSKKTLTQKTPRQKALAKAATERAKAQRATRAQAATKSKAASKPKAKTATGSTKSSAKRAVSKPTTKRVSKPKTDSRARSRSRAVDDLKLIKGVGPQNEKKLNSIGVRRFADVAKWTKKQQRDIGDRLAFPGRIEREDWVKQAKAFAKSAGKS